MIKKKDDVYEKSFHELLVVSPFISKDIIKQFNDRSRWVEHTEYMLITREASLDKLRVEECDNFRIYVLKDEIVDGEMAISDGERDYCKHDIHAKIYMIRKNADTEVYFGSLNASHNAVYGNIEFMILLKSKNRYINLEKLKKDIFGGDEDGPNNPFKEVLLSDGEAEEEKNSDGIDILIKQINRYNIHAIVIENGDYYDVKAVVENYEKLDANIKLSPILLKPKAVDFSEIMLFEKMAMSFLSEFYVLSISDNCGNTVNRVIKIDTEGIPRERDGKIISSIIGDNEQNFYRYLGFLLGDDYIISAIESDVLSGQNNEKMLKTAATAPERFVEIEKLIQVLSGDDIVPEAFRNLYDTFRKVVK